MKYYIIIYNYMHVPNRNLCRTVNITIHNISCDYCHHPHHALSLPLPSSAAAAGTVSVVAVGQLPVTLAALLLVAVASLLP